MGTIARRSNKDGHIRYTAQIRLRRNGLIVYQETQSFERLMAAKAWLQRRESELAQPGALENAKRKNIPLVVV